MKISTDRKLQLLVNNFEALKEDAAENIRSLQNLLAQIGTIDLALGLDLWQNLIEANIGYAQSNRFGEATQLVLLSISNAVGDSHLYDEVLKREKLKKYLFFESGCVYGQWLIHYAIITNQLIYANELLELSYRNKHRIHSFADVLCDDTDRGAIPSDYEPISDAAIELLEYWIEKVEDIKERARLTTKLLALFENE